MAELRAKITVDADVDGAKSKLRQFQSDIEGMFRRRTGLRAELAIEGAIREITSGNVLGAIEMISTRISGIGLAAGVAFSAVAYGINKSMEATKAFADLLEKTEDRLKAPIAGAGQAQLTSRVAEDLKSINELQKATQSFWGQFNPMHWVEQIKALGTFLQLRGDINKSLRAERDLSKDIAKDAIEKARGDKDAAAVADIMLRRNKELYEIQQRRESDLASPTAKGDWKVQQEIKETAKKESADITRASEAEYQAAVRNAALGKESVQAEKEKTAIRAQGLTPEAEKLALMRGQEASLQRQLEIMSKATGTEKEMLEAKLEALKVDIKREEKADLAKKIGLPEGGYTPTMEDLLRAGQLVGNRGLQTQRRMNFPVALQGDAYFANLTQRLMAESERFGKAGLKDASASYAELARQSADKIQSFKPEEPLSNTGIGNAVGGHANIKAIEEHLKAIKDKFQPPNYQNK